MTLRDPQMFKSDNFYGEKTSLDEKFLNASAPLKDVQSTTGPSSWVDNTDIMHVRPSFSVSRTTRLDLRSRTV